MPKSSRLLPSKVLAEAKDADLARVLVVGKYKNGKLYVAGSSPLFKHLEDIEQFVEDYRDGLYDSD